jgi:hypothetical protein
MPMGNDTRLCRKSKFLLACALRGASCSVGGTDVSVMLQATTRQQATWQQTS